MMQTLRRVAPFALLTLVSCGNSAKPSVETRVSALDRVRAVPVFQRSLASAPALVQKGAIFASDRVELPETMDRAVRFSEGGFAIRALDVASRKGVLEARAVTYADVASETDLIVHAVTSGFEELRVLRGPSAPSEMRWSLEGKSRLVDGHVELLDESGAVGVRSELAFAVDAAGVRRDLALRLEGSTLTAKLDTAGLRYPIVVDPTWLYVVSTIPSGNFYGYAWVQPNPQLVLQLGGSNNINDGTASFDVPSEKWTARPIPPPPYHTYSQAVWLPSIGKAFEAGAANSGGGYQNDAFLYSPTFVMTPIAATMTTGRAFHTLTVVNVSGAERVLIVGGATGTVSVEMYDVATSTFSPKAPLGVARTKHAATLLGSGKVLVTGGHPGSTATPTGEVYDPAANTWTAVTGAMADARYDHAQALLPDGRVLIAGGQNASNVNLDSTTIYDPATNAFSVGPKMSKSRSQFTITTLPSGKMLFAGGINTGATPTSSTEIYDPTTSTFTDGPTMKVVRAGHRAALLSGGRVLVGTGTNSGNVTEILWPDGITCTSSSGTCPNCVDGYCCDSACSGQCDACDIPGKQGVCSPVAGEAPHGARGTCSPFTVCAYDASKASSSCATACASDAACGAGTYCNTPGPTGSCAPTQADGAGCSSASQCTSGKCVDGTCCATDCTGQCESCSEPSAPGVCTKVDGMPRSARPVCSAPFACSAGACATMCTKDIECATGRTCDVATKTCVPKKGNGAVCTTAGQCSSGQCVDGVCCNTDCTSGCFACNVAGKVGTCSAVATGDKPHGTRNCGLYAVCAAAGVCAINCTSGADCISGECDSASSLCTGMLDAGPEVGPDGGTDGASTTDIGIADGAAPDPGPKPTIGEFIKCTKSSDCATGHCVEGVCCDTACDDRCHSCSLLTSPGKCTLEPLGVDLKNECGPAVTCVGTCDGTGECIGAGKGTMCSRNRCSGASTGVGPAYCPSPGGKCSTDDVVPFDCAPYVCEPAFGACITTCRSSADCANGFICDVAGQICVAPPPAEDSGGCSVSTDAPSSRSAYPFASLVLVGLLGALRAVKRRR